MVGPVDVVDRSLSLVPVMNFSDGDQLDGLALRRQMARHASELTSGSSSVRQLQLPKAWRVTGRTGAQYGLPVLHAAVVTCHTTVVVAEGQLSK